MKYRQAKKLIKKDKLLPCWLKDNNDWVDAAVNATLGGDELSITVLKICEYYIWWSWKYCLERSHKYDIKSKQLKKYCWKTYGRKN